MSNVININQTYIKYCNSTKEMKRIQNLYKMHLINKSEALDMFQRYLALNYGREAFREFPYKQVA